MKGKSLLILLAILISAIAVAQDEITKSFSLHSEALNEERSIQVYTPPQVNSIKQTYPVLYVFDGESLLWPTVNASSFMNKGSSLPQIPEVIVVSIKNNNRDRDMPVPQQIASTNGAAQFLQFVADELVPYINDHYPVNGLNVLIGHSQGGLFVIYAGLKKPALFPFILSLDAPVTVNPSLLKEYQQKMTTACTLNYFSAETMYGWGTSFTMAQGCGSYRQKRIEEETHETMPYKGIYDGLKFLFREHIPEQKDMPLSMLQAYYKNLSDKYHCRYTIPDKILLSSARENISVSKKQVSLDLLEFYEKNYGTTQTSANLLAKANAITKEPDKRVDYYLSNPGASAEDLKPFMGKWKGTLIVPGGVNMDITWEIKKINNKYVMDARFMDEFNSRSDFLVVTAPGQIAWGRKHEGGGIYLSIGKLSANGRTITGTEDLIGFQMPDNVPAFKVNQFEFNKIQE